MAETFATMVAEIRVDDSSLARDLRRDEQLIVRSSEKMSQALARVQVGMGGVGDAAFDTTAGLSAFSSAAGALGGTLGGVVGQTSAAIISIKSMGAAFKGINVAILGAAGGALALLAYRKELIEMTTAFTFWAFSIDKATQKTKAFTAAQNKAEEINKLNVETMRKLQLATGLLSQEEFRRQELLDKFSPTSNRGREMIEQQLTLEAGLRKAAELAAATERVKARAAKRDVDAGKRLIDDAKELNKIRAAGIAKAEAAALTTKQTRAAAAQSALIATGVAPSTLERDPVISNLMRLVEQLNATNAGGGAGGVQGTIGSRALGSVRSDGLQREGFIGGQQQIGKKDIKLSEDRNKILKDIRTAAEKFAPSVGT